MPCHISKTHGLKLIDVINEGRQNIVVIAVNCTTDKLSMVMRLEAADDAGIVRLDMGGEIGNKVLNTNICEIVRWRVGTEVVLEQKNMTALLLQLLIPVANPLLI